MTRWLGGALLLVACGRPQADTRALGRVAQQALTASGVSWRTIDASRDGFNLYVQRGSAADSDAQAVTDSVRAARRDVLALLEEPAAAREVAALFFIGSRSEMQRVAGRPIAGFAQPGEPTAFFVWSDDYRAPLRHELAHLYTLERWGLPLARNDATWLVEGIGAWAGGPCQEHSVDELAAGLLARNSLPTARELELNFRHLREDAAMPAAGSLVQFLYRKEGVDGLRDRWRADALLSLPDSATQAAWRAHLATIPPAELDVDRVMREGC